MRELRPEDLYRRCDPERFDFETTRDLEAPEELLGQPRATAAVELGVGMSHLGYNVFALGAPGTGKHRAIERLLRRRAAERPVPPDLCYVNNFEDPRKPRLLELPAGRGRELQRDVEKLVEELGGVLSAAFESEEYQTRRQVLEESFAERQGKALSELAEKAREQEIALLRTPMGIVFAPMRDGEVLSPEEFEKLPEEDQQGLEQRIEPFQTELQKIFQKLPGWQREKRRQVRDLNREVSRRAVVPLLAELRERYGELDGVVRFLQAVEEDVIHNAPSFLARESEQAQQPSQQPSPPPVAGAQSFDRPFLRRYGVNLLVDHGDDRGAPVVYEPNPTYNNLIGRIEHLSQMGALVTDFQLIRAGALHQADGGYLILDALEVLTTPFAWDALKRTLLSGQIKLESMGEALSLVTTYSLEPEPDPLEVKVVLLGPPIVYYLLSYHDPDFPKLFKVAADFDDRMDRGAAEEALYARQVAGLVADEELRPFDRGAVARVIEDGARHLGDAHKLSLDLRRLRDLMREADHWAGWEGREVVTAEDVQRAIDEHTFRSDRLRERIHEGILRGTVLIDTDGAHVGRINGLAVLQLGDFHFGRPSRITARVRMGKGEVVDIEREVELSGPFHSKGVLILAGYLGAHYARDHPLALEATVVFEQSYGGVDGDSASSTELYALLSAVAEVPIRQSLAVTGSINQQGEIQAIGGVNEKIEGFFDVCRARGLTGDQGVLIPASNVEHLMLRHDVVAAVAEGRFHIYPVRRVEEGIELLTGLPAGERDDSGAFPEGSFNRRVEERLIELARVAREFSKGAATGGGKEGA